MQNIIWWLFSACYSNDIGALEAYAAKTNEQNTAVMIKK